MKNLIKHLNILVIMLVLTSCEEESNFAEPNVQLVPVYSITDIQGGNLFKINIYREKDLIVEYTSQLNAYNYVSSNYSDTSSDTAYQFSVDKITDSTTVNYTINGLTNTGEGTITIDGTTTLDVMISRTEVYN